MKIIKQEEINAIIEAFFKCNAPVQLYAGVKDMLEKLPEAPVSKEEELDK